MRLDKLRGYGPWLSYASAACLALAIVCMMASVATINPPQKPGAAFAGLWIAAVLFGALWMVTLLAVAVDLEWIEHPLTHTGMTYVALAGAALATLALVILLATSLTSIPDPLAAILGFCFAGGVGIYLVIINLVGRRARVISGALAWLGVVDGALFVVGAVLVVVGFAPALVLPVMIAVPLYLIWSIWLGFQLRRNAPAPSGTTPAPA